MIKDKSYIHGTAARKLEYDVYEENKVLNAKRKQRSSNKVKIKLILSLLVIFSLGSLVMYRYTQITELNYRIDKELKAYNEVKNENIRIKVSIENNLDIQKIKEVAEKKLGMQKPDKHQITYVKVPRNDFTVVSSEVKRDKDGPGVLSALMSKVDKLSKLLY
ncbi:MAG: cell division protein FtsL [Bacillota bacterium]